MSIQLFFTVILAFAVLFTALGCAFLGMRVSQLSGDLDTADRRTSRNAENLRLLQQYWGVHIVRNDPSPDHQPFKVVTTAERNNRIKSSI